MISAPTVVNRPALKRLRLPLTVLACALLLWSCSPSGSGVKTLEGSVAAKSNRLVIGIQQEPDKLNSVLNAMVYGTYINQTIYGYFVKYDENKQLVPDVITEVPTLENGGISPDGLTYTYHLRDDVRWHDGTPLTSADIRFSVDAILDTRHEVETRLGFDKVERLETPDDHTVVFHLREPYVKFVSDTFFDEPIMPNHLLADTVGPEFNSHPFHRGPVGCGPFKFKEWVSGSHVTVVRNDDYFRGPPAIDEITFRFIEDSNSLLVALQAGEIDSYDNAATDQFDRLKAMPNVTPYVTPAIMWEHLDFNTEDPILSDVRVRQAIQLAIDREEISREVYADLWPPAYGDIPEDMSWFNPKVHELVRHDPAAAEKLLDEAGWTVGSDGIREKGGQRLSIPISTTAGRQQRELTEQVLQQHLRRVGIELRIENHNATAFFAPFADQGVLKRGRFALGMYAWISSPDPDRRNLYHSEQIPPPDGQNHTRLADDRLDELCDLGLRTVDVAKRKEIYDEIQELLATQVPMTPLVWRADIDPMTTRLKNFKPNPTQTGDTWNAHEWVLAD